jgi:hypothetical protein
MQQACDGSRPAAEGGEPPSAARDAAEPVRAELLALLQPGAAPADPARVRALIETLEHTSPADLDRDRALLAGVWELRWSSSRLPYLAVAPWLENLQLLDPDHGRGMNLLRLSGPLGPLAGIAVQAELTLAPAPEGQRAQRVGVRFKRGGWLGPLLGERRLSLFRQVSQRFPAWLDITVLDQDLRVCRGNAGTLFALRRRTDLRLQDLMPHQDS